MIEATKDTFACDMQAACEDTKHQVVGIGFQAKREETSYELDHFIVISIICGLCYRGIVLVYQNNDRLAVMSSLHADQCL